MTKKQLLAALSIALLMLSACGTQHDEADKQYSVEEILDKADSVTFSSDVMNPNSAFRKIVRNADLRCEVADVYNATTELEAAVTSLGGIVQESKIQNDDERSLRTRYGQDSLKEVTTYTTTAFLTLRVPTMMVDSLNKTIAGLVSYTEHRQVNQTDVTLQYMSNALKNKALKEHRIEEPVNNTDKNYNTVVAANEYNKSAETARIDRRIENLKLLDETGYAALNVDFYQPQTVRTQIIADVDAIMKPSYGYRFSEALRGSWNFTLEILLFMLRIWPIILVAGLVIFIVMKLKNTRLSVRGLRK